MSDFEAPLHVSTGTLPDRDRVAALVVEAHDRYRDTHDGQCSQVYPALAAADPSLYGLCLLSTAGTVHCAGDSDVRFALMSLAKPFVLALVCELVGAETVRQAIGLNATGAPFNSVEAVERAPGGRTNPMVNAGAIATIGLVPGSSVDDKWAFMLDGLSRFVGRPLELDDDVYRSVAATNHRNRALGNLLHSLGALETDPDEAVELYTRQSCLSVDAGDLAGAGATLANGGVQPITGERVVEASVCHGVMATMATAGLYDTSGDWLWDIGLPGKSGIGGGIVAVSPGKGALGVFSPPLDTAGNSVRGQLAAAFLSKALGLDLFATTPSG
ncbi:MAG: glutaminase A [Acidimicrobiales bacterium]